MGCVETNLAPKKQRNGHSGVNQPKDNHELYVVLSYAGESLEKVAKNIVYYPGQKTETAEELVKKKVDKTMNLIGELITGLHYMGLSGVVHHDLKPDNIMFREVPDGKSGGHAVFIDFGAMLRADAPIEIDGVFTPGFAPPEFTQRKPVVPSTSFDVFSMAGVISQILLGENLVYRWSRLRIPNDPSSFVVDWVGFYRVMNDADKFKKSVLQVASKPGFNNAQNPRQPILERIMAKYPNFLNNWREMWGGNGEIRTRGAEKMWQMFLHGA